MSTLPVSLIQTASFWEDPALNRSRFAEKIQLIRERTSLIVLPEMFTTGFTMNAAAVAEPMNGPTMQWMHRMAEETKAVITGSLVIAESGHYYNRLIWMLPDGRFGHYDKRHLFAYAGEHNSYSPGNRRMLARIGDWTFNLMVCYDLRFPIWSRQAPGSVPEYDVLLYVANWPARRSHAWRTLLQARAIENQCYVIAVNRIGRDGNDHEYKGDSMVINPLGEITHSPGETDAVVTTHLQKEALESVRNKFPFWRDGDGFRIDT